MWLNGFKSVENAASLKLKYLKNNIIPIFIDLNKIVEDKSK